MTEIEGMIETVGKDIRPLLGRLPTASTKKQVRLLETIAVTAEYAAKQIGEKLEFGHTLDVFNQHGAEAVSPFGAVLLGDRVMVSRYTDSLGRHWNGCLMSKEFITREVAVRWGWEREIRQ